MTTAEILQLLREGSAWNKEEMLTACKERIRPDWVDLVRYGYMGGFRDGESHRDSQLQPILAKAFAALELALEQRDRAIQCATRSLEAAEMNSNRTNQDIVDLVKGMK